MLNLSDKYNNGKVTASNYVKSIKDDVKNNILRILIFWWRFVIVSLYTIYKFSKV